MGFVQFTNEETEVSAEQTPCMRKNAYLKENTYRKVDLKIL